MRISKTYKSVVVYLSATALIFLHSTTLAQGIVSSFDRSSPSYTELYFYSGLGSSLGINHIKELTPKTSVLIGASYTNFRFSPLNYDGSFLPLSFYNLRSELRHYLTPKEKQLSAFVFAAVNNTSFLNNFIKPSYNLGLEVGGEVRYKIGDNAHFSIRSSIYRGNGYRNPYVMSPEMPMR